MYFMVVKPLPLPPPTEPPVTITLPLQPTGMALAPSVPYAGPLQNTGPLKELVSAGVT